MRQHPPDNLLRIGDFAEVCGVPAKTLRYYDQIELFNPAYVDRLTDYRYYSRDQLPWNQPHPSPQGSGPLTEADRRASGR